jgi:hypothetical protein
MNNTTTIIATVVNTTTNTANSILNKNNYFPIIGFILSLINYLFS